MKLEICVFSKNDYDIVKEIFSDIQDIVVNNKSITNAEYPIIVSAGNSFGMMDGGVDGRINMFLSSYTPDSYIMDDVKKMINENFFGELPVGQSIVVETKHPKYTHLIYTPTMRVAEDVSNTLNAYIAFRSMVIIMKRNNINISTPLFCTGAGCMSVNNACIQMKEAYLSVINETLINRDWKTYHTHHRFLKKLT